MTQTDEFGFPLDDSEVEGQQPQSNEGKGIKQIREAYEAQAAAYRELREKFEKLEAKNRATSVGDILKGKNVNTKLAKYVLRDAQDAKAEVNDEFVSKWLEDNGDAFGVEVQPANDEPANVEPEIQQQYEAISAASNGGAAPTGMQAKLAKLEALKRIDPRSPEYKQQLDAVWD